MGTARHFALSGTEVARSLPKGKKYPRKIIAHNFVGPASTTFLMARGDGSGGADPQSTVAQACRNIQQPKFNRAAP
jgi:hypothetical protein